MCNSIRIVIEIKSLIAKISYPLKLAEWCYMSVSGIVRS